MLLGISHADESRRQWVTSGLLCYSHEQEEALEYTVQIFSVLGEHFHSGKFSQLYLCFVNHSLLLLLLLIETLVAFFHILYFANTSTGNQQALQTKTLTNTFGLLEG